MEQGAKIDIATLQPLEKVQEQREQERTAKEIERLRKNAEYRGIADSQPGMQFITIIVLKLEDRVRQLITCDPEAKAYMGILSDIGVKEDLARKAVARLTEMKITHGS
ncbi:MAG TPA: hypothetical protein PLC82_12290 [Smithellaceae bacterium]|jgi:uncharacterized protein YjiS (DUF1127 family)|nr:hypothetical protein [Smithellaceae bacterium]